MLKIRSWFINPFSFRSSHGVNPWLFVFAVFAVDAVLLVQVSQAQTETVIYNFKGGTSDGSAPWAVFSWTPEVISSAQPQPGELTTTATEAARCMNCRLPDRAGRSRFFTISGVPSTDISLPAVWLRIAWEISTARP